MAGQFRTCEGVKFNGVALMLLFAVTLLSGIGLGEAATCSTLLDNYYTSSGVYTNESVVIPFLTPVTQAECLSSCTQNCLCVGYAYFSPALAASNVSCYTYLTLAGDTIQDSNVTLYKRQARSCSNLLNEYKFSSGAKYSLTYGISIPVLDNVACQNSCSSSCSCVGCSFDLLALTNVNCILYWNLTDKISKGSDVWFYERQGLPTSAGSGNPISKIGGISGGVFNLLLIGGGFFLSVYFTG